MELHTCVVVLFKGKKSATDDLWVCSKKSPNINHEMRMELMNKVKGQTKVVNANQRRRSMTIVATIALIAICASGRTASAATLKLQLLGGSATNSGCELNRQPMRISGNTEGEYFNGRTAHIRVWGDDTFSDDFLEGPIIINNGFEGHVRPGAFYRQTICVLFDNLDEDLGIDDIYVGVRFFNSSGETREIENTTTNTLHARF